MGALNDDSYLMSRYRSLQGAGRSKEVSTFEVKASKIRSERVLGGADEQTT